MALLFGFLGCKEREAMAEIKQRRPTAERSGRQMLATTIVAT
jgi:hypothetical protein